MSLFKEKIHEERIFADPLQSKSPENEITRGLYYLMVIMKKLNFLFSLYSTLTILLKFIHGISLIDAKIGYWKDLVQVRYYKAGPKGVVIIFLFPMNCLLQKVSTRVKHDSVGIIPNRD